MAKTTPRGEPRKSASSKVKKLTERRVKIISAFLTKTMKSPQLYADFQSPAWMKVLIQFLCEPKRCRSNMTDIRVWLQADCFHQLVSNICNGVGIETTPILVESESASSHDSRVFHALKLVRRPDSGAEMDTESEEAELVESAPFETIITPGRRDDMENLKEEEMSDGDENPFPIARKNEQDLDIKRPMEPNQFPAEPEYEVIIESSPLNLMTIKTEGSCFVSTTMVSAKRELEAEMDENIRVSSECPVTGSQEQETGPFGSNVKSEETAAVPLKKRKIAWDAIPEEEQAEVATPPVNLHDPARNPDLGQFEQDMNLPVDKPGQNMDDLSLVNEDDEQSDTLSFIENDVPCCGSSSQAQDHPGQVEVYQGKQQQQQQKTTFRNKKEELVEIKKTMNKCLAGMMFVTNSMRVVEKLQPSSSSTDPVGGDDDKGDDIDWEIVFHALSILQNSLKIKK